MMHILHPQKDELLGFLDREHYWDDDHQQGLHGVHLIQFTTHSDSEESGLLVDRCRLLRQSTMGGWQEFVAYKIKSLSVRTKKVIATGSEAELDRLKIIEPGTKEGYTLEKYTAEAIAGTGWEIGDVDYAGIQTHTFDKHMGAYKFLMRVAEYFDRELRFRIEVSGNRIVGRYVDLLERIGSDKRKEIVAGENLIGIERTLHSERLVTALYCIGPERGDGTRLTTLVTDEGAFQRWNWKGQHIIDFYEPETEGSEMTLDRLTTLGDMALKKRINSVVVYVVNAAVLSDDDVSLGDTLRIKDEDFVPPLYAESRAVFVKEPISGEAIDKTYTVGEIVELEAEDVLRTFRDLQKRYGTRVIKSPTPPPGHSNVIWIQTETNTGLDIAHTWDGSQWVSVTPVTPEQVGAEPKIPISTTPPQNPKVGDKWVDSSGELAELKIWNGAEWKAVEGPPGIPGLDGYTPVKGTDYFDGRDGQDGTDGTSSYIWVRYSQTSTGTNMVDNPTGAKYIGIATTEIGIAPTAPSAYRWSLVKGMDGVPGEDGADGRTSYLHIKYSNDGGSTFTANNGEAVGDWIGTYVDFTEVDSNSPVAYTWNKVKGEKGDTGSTGIQGPPGANGQTLYTWVKYADTPTTGMSDSPVGKTYFGIAYNKTTATKSATYADYSWSLIKGADGNQGIQGPPGANGQTTYTWIKYANDANGGGMSDSPVDKRYLGIAYNKGTVTESTNPADYTWSPLFDNVQVGGRNLLRNSKLNTTSNNYLIANLTLTESITAGTTVTVSIKGLLGAGKSSFTLYNSGGAIPIVSVVPADRAADGIYRKTFPWVVGSSLNTAVSIYVMPSSVSVNSTIDWIKLEKGNVPTDWTPALEDVDGAITQAQTTADGKNTVFYSTSAPSIVGRKIDDVWFDTANGNRMSRYSGSAWVLTEFGANAIANLSITNAKIANGAIDNAKIANLDAGKVTTGTLTGITVEVGQAGMTADGALATSVRYWAGATYAGRNTAPFRVLQSGKVVATNIDIMGGSISIATDATVGRNLYLGAANDYDSPKTVYFNEGARITGGTGVVGRSIDLNCDGLNYIAGQSYLWYGMRFVNYGFYSSVDVDFEPGVRVLVRGGLVSSGAEFTRSAVETGYMGIGAVMAGRPTGSSVAGQGVNFRISKTYTPSSISFSQVSGNLNAGQLNINTITNQGFFLFLTGWNSSDLYYFWRGTYTA